MSSSIELFNSFSSLATDEVDLPSREDVIVRVTRMTREELSSNNRQGFHELKNAIYIYGPEKIASQLLRNGGDLTVLNEPNYNGITPIHKLARDGKVDLLQQIFDKIKAPILANDDAHFDEATLRTCEAVSDELLLNELPIDQIDFSPLVVAQNFCSAVVKLKNGKLLTLNNADAGRVYASLMEKKQGQKLIKGSTLTAYLNPGHGFLGLECKSCEDKKLSAGFAFADSIPGYSTSLPNKMTLMPFGTGHVTANIESLDISNETNFLKVVFHLTEDQAVAARAEIDAIAKSCEGFHKNGENRCIYEMWSRNCIDFVNRIYKSTGAKGHFAEFFTEHQLVGDMHRIFPNAGAIQYTYATSRGFLPFVQAQFGFPQPLSASLLTLLNGTEKATYPSAQFNNAITPATISATSVMIGLIAGYALYQAGSSLYQTGKSLWKSIRET